MKQRQFHRAIYRLRHHYLTLNNVIVGFAFIIAAGWVWGSLDVMQRNYTLQQNLNKKNQELQLAELEARNLELEREYYKTREYQELAVRERLGKGTVGEKLLILPKQDESAVNTTATKATVAARSDAPPSNFEQWMDFLFGSKS